MRETLSGVPSFTIPSEFGLLQNYPSILCSHVLNPQKEDLILDMCAAPGNKTTHIASLIGGKVILVILSLVFFKIIVIFIQVAISRKKNISLVIQEKFYFNYFVIYQP